MQYVFAVRCFAIQIHASISRFVYEPLAVLESLYFTLSNEIASSKTVPPFKMHTVA